MHAQWILKQKREKLLGFCFFFFLIGVQLTDNVLLVSGVQQSESVTHVYISALCSFEFSF